jgi:hypothetical protein
MQGKYDVHLVCNFTTTIVDDPRHWNYIAVLAWRKAEPGQYLKGGVATVLATVVKR